VVSTPLSQHAAVTVLADVVPDYTSTCGVATSSIRSRHVWQALRLAIVCMCDAGPCPTLCLLVVLLFRLRVEVLVVCL